MGKKFGALCYQLNIYIIFVSLKFTLIEGPGGVSFNIVEEIFAVNFISPIGLIGKRGISKQFERCGQAWLISGMTLGIFDLVSYHEQ